MRRLTTILILLVALLLGCAPNGEFDDGVVRLSYDDSLQSWRAEVRVDHWQRQPGESITLNVDLRAKLPLLAEHPELWEGLYLVAWGERLYDRAGAPSRQSNIFMSGFFTPGGLPIESGQTTPMLASLGAAFGSPLESSVFIPREALRGKILALRQPLTIPVAPDCPPGIYRLHLRLLVKIPTREAILDLHQISALIGRYIIDADPQSLPLLGMLKLRESYFPNTYLPPLRVGDPEPPHMPVTLLSDRIANGVRGVVSEQDRRHFALSHRTKLNGELVLRQGDYDLALSPVAYYPLSGIPEKSQGAHVLPSQTINYLDWASGVLQWQAIDPHGGVAGEGNARVTGIDNGLMQTELPARMSLHMPGRYRVIVEGHVDDQLGRRYNFGGDYVFWIAQPLSFSTAAKLGTSFFPGQSFPPKVQIHPMVPAYVKLHVRYFPQSDKTRMREIEVDGYANEFGYFVPSPNQKRMTFDEPGEYDARIRAAYVDPYHQLWYGSQQSAGVVAERAPAITLHGAKQNSYGMDHRKPDFGLPERYHAHDEGSFPNTRFLDYVDCQAVNPPYYSGDVLYVATTMDGANNVQALMVQNAHPPAWRRDCLERFRRLRPFLLNQPWARPHLFDQAITLGVMTPVTFPLNDATDQMPILSRHRHAWSPYNFPEGADLYNYYYFTAIRPGFPAYSIITDGTMHQAYWNVSGNRFGDQLNAGPNGDLPEDIYRLDAGLVYRDEATGRRSYAAYAATLMVLPPHSYANRVTAPAAEPLLNVNGLDYPLFLAIEAGAILHPGQPLALAAMVFPPVAAQVNMQMTTPSGRIESVSGPASELGIFSRPEGVYRLNEPGVYRIKAETEYAGKHGGVLGAPNDEYFHFVVAPDRRQFVSVAGPMVHEFDPAGVVPIRLQIDPAINNPVLTWSIVCPGIVMDSGQMPLAGHDFEYRFIPTQFAMQFPNFEVVDLVNGRPRMGKSVFFVFFVEGTDEQGRKVCDVATLITRDNRLVAMPGGARADEASRAALTPNN